MKIHWTEAALGDLRSIWTYIAADNENAADRMFDRLRAAAERLAEFPERGRRNPALRIRELPVPGTPYVIFYRVRSGSIEILRVMHGARDWPRNNQA